MPLRVNDIRGISYVAEWGDDVSIVEQKEGGSKRVYKEFCYHLREKSSIMIPTFVIEPRDQRRPPPRELLEALGHPYNEWEVHVGPFGVQVLSYNFLEGTPADPSREGWIMILKQVHRMHAIGFVHGDLLPRNVLFQESTRGYVIDFDSSRMEGEKYVSGFDHDSFQTFRHEDARARKIMKKEHDLHYLRQLTKHFFDVSSHNVESFSLLQLIALFEDYDSFAVLGSEWTGDDVSGSQA